LPCRASALDLKETEMSDAGDPLDPVEVRSEAAGDALGSAGVSWRREGRPPTVGEARDYFDAHATGGGDAEILQECERVLDATGPGARSAPFPRPSEDQLEEEGSD
jgi:hypothetical protein